MGISVARQARIDVIADQTGNSIPSIISKGPVGEDARTAHTFAAQITDAYKVKFNVRNLAGFSYLFFTDDDPENIDVSTIESGESVGFAIPILWLGDGTVMDTKTLDRWAEVLLPLNFAFTSVILTDGGGDSENRKCSVMICRKNETDIEVFGPAQAAVMISVADPG